MSEEMFSGTKPIDDRFKFNLEGLKTYFSENLKEFGNINSVVQFKGGQSNPTYKVSTQKKELVLRRKPPGKLLPSAHAVDREFRVISALENTDVPVPKTFGLCNDREVIGTEFYIMEYLDGAIYWDLLLEKLEPDDRRKIYVNKNKVISALHTVNFDDVGLSDYGKSGDYVARQVSRWTKQYIASETENIESMNKLIEWLPKNIPANDQTSIVHGDFRLDNIVFSQNNVLGVLDWELSTLGHPIADFNYHCLNWRNLPELQDEKFCKRSGIPTEKEYLAMYCENTGNDISYDWDFYYIFNIFKLAGILQGIMGRVRDGTAASKHAEERSDQIVPLADAAWDLVKKNYL